MEYAYREEGCQDSLVISTSNFSQAYPEGLMHIVMQAPEVSHYSSIFVLFCFLKGPPLVSAPPAEGRPLTQVF